MLLIDGIVTKGMSGGGVFDRAAWPNLLGIISAHVMPQPPIDAWRTLPDTVQRAALSLWEALTPMNAALVYAVPASRVLDFLRSRP
jgi:hypothetical protein